MRKKQRTEVATATKKYGAKCLISEEPTIIQKEYLPSPELLYE